MLLLLPVHADVARQVLRHEGGPLGLFKGLTATLWRESLGNMAMFGVYELIKQQMVASKGLASTQQLSHSDLLLAGGLGGTAFWLGCYPLGECTRVGVLAAADGQCTEQLRVTASHAVLHCCYDSLVEPSPLAGAVNGWAMLFRACSSAAHLTTCLLICACCPLLCLCAPPDIIKSKIQVDSYASPKYRGILDCGRQIIADQGIKGIYRGFAPALARSFPANAVCFAVYEAVKASINSAISPAGGAAAV